jgi:hypothetical protein
MLKYQIHKLSKGGKEARSVLLEDILTSDVFGLMSYFSYDFLLRVFLEDISARNLDSNFSVPSVEPIKLNFWESIGWPETLPKLGRKGIEPDVVIEWDDTLLFVEAKFLSPTDPEELLREFLVGTSQTSGQKRFFILLIDRNLSPQNVSSQEGSLRITIPEYLERRLKKLNLSNNIATEVSHSFLWINWQSFYLLIEELLKKSKSNEISKVNSMGEKILADLIEILQRESLTPFRELDLELFESWVVDLHSLGEVGVRIRKRHSDLSDVSIDLSILDNIGMDVDDPLASLSQFNIDAHSLDFLPARKSGARR